MFDLIFLSMLRDHSPNPNRSNYLALPFFPQFILTFPRLLYTSFSLSLSLLHSFEANLWLFHESNREQAESVHGWPSPITENVRASWLSKVRLDRHGMRSNDVFRKLIWIEWNVSGVPKGDSITSLAALRNDSCVESVVPQIFGHCGGTFHFCSEIWSLILFFFFQCNWTVQS